jgi:hypothetical protein
VTLLAQLAALVAIVSTGVVYRTDAFLTRGPGVFDHPDRLVAEDRARPHPGHRAADEVQVRAANRARRDPHDGVGRRLDGRLRYLIDRHLTYVVPDNSFLAFLPYRLPTPLVLRLSPAS